MKRICFVFLMLISHAAYGMSSYYPLSFKSKMYDMRDDELKQELFKVLDMKHIGGKKEDVLVHHCDQAKGRCYSQRILGYRAARKILFGKLHLQTNSHGQYFVRDVYCHKNFTRGVGPSMIPDHNVLNCEHTWPQSKFNDQFPKEMQKSDLHHLFPTDSRANGIRGNYEFGEVNNLNSELCNTSQVGVGRGGHNRFEPPAEHRGNVARALFYFSVRYKQRIHSTHEKILRKWHNDDPVDIEEQKRNDQIHYIQGNRNPFIDMPNMVDRIGNF